MGSSRILLVGFLSTTTFRIVWLLYCFELLQEVNSFNSFDLQLLVLKSKIITRRKRRRHSREINRIATLNRPQEAVFNNFASILTTKLLEEEEETLEKSTEEEKVHFGQLKNKELNNNDSLKNFSLLNKYNNTNTTSNENSAARRTETKEKSISSRVSCQIVAERDRKLPDSNSPCLPDYIRGSDLLQKLVSIYHAMAQKSIAQLQKDYYNYDKRRQIPDQYCCNEQNLVSSLKSSLQDAGFVRLQQRDWDLCDALNAGYLLRLSIQPNLKNLDPSLGKLFYPNQQHLQSDATMIEGSRQSRLHSKLLNSKKNNTNMLDDEDSSPLLFDGRVLVFRRGYSAEVTEGRLLLPKLDYLQTTIVQRSTTAAIRFVNQFEKSINTILFTVLQKLGIQGNTSLAEHSKFNSVGLSRYSGSKKTPAAFDRNSALAPFLFLNNGTEKEGIVCEYDLSRGKASTQTSSCLLERVSISDVVDHSFTSQSQLVEPTYDEVVVIWRPLSKKMYKRQKVATTIYKFAEVFDMEDCLSALPLLQQEKAQYNLPIEIRIFKGVQMSNLPAVFPQTKLIFKPSDAFVNDLITLFTFLAVLVSLKYDSVKYDVIALLSIIAWLTRTLVRYSNKIARYDLLVKNFITSKLTSRGPSALRYIVSQAGQQRAVRAALLYHWILNLATSQSNVKESADDEHEAKLCCEISESDLLLQAKKGVNELLVGNDIVEFDTIAALRDLEDVKLIQKNQDGHYLISSNSTLAISLLRERWIELFDY